MPKISSEKAVELCDRNFGVGADGVIFLMAGTNGADYTMRIFNSDGSEPEVIPFFFYHNNCFFLCFVFLFFLDIYIPSCLMI